MRGLALRSANWGALTGLTVLGLAAALGISLTRSDLALGIGLGVILLVVAFLSTEAALYILIASMLFSPELIAGQIGGGAALGRGVTLRLDDFILIIIGFGWFARTAINQELGLFKKTPLNRPILYYTLVTIFSTLAGVSTGRVDLKTGFFFVLKFFEYFFLYFMVINHITEKAQIRRFALAAFVICGLVSLYGIAQIPFGERVTAPFEGEAGEPNTLGGYLVFMLSIAGGLFFHLESGRSRILMAGLAAMMVAALLFTLSRGSYLAALMVLGLFLIQKMLVRQNIVVVAALGGLVLIVATVGLLRIGPRILPSQVTERIEYTFSPQVTEGLLGQVTAGQIEVLRQRGGGEVEMFGVGLDTSTSARIINWMEAFQDFREHPLLGSGVTGYRFLDAQYPRTLVETGVLGLAAFLYLLYHIGQQGLLAYRVATDPYHKGLALGFVIGFLGLLIHAIGANTFIIVRIMEPFWLFAALVLSPAPADASRT